MSNRPVAASQCRAIASYEVFMMSIPNQPPKTVPAPMLGNCPGCHTEIAPRLQLALESISAAAKRPVTPELLILCRECRRQFVVSLHPALASGQ